MLNRYDWKNIIKRIIIGVGIAFILFNINKCNAYALVYKNGWWYGTIDSAQKTGTMNASDSKTLRFDLNVNEIQADYVGFNFDVFDFHNTSYITTNSSVHYCTKWEQYTQTSPIYSVINECKATSTDNITNIATSTPEYSISFQIYDNTGLGHWCFLSSEYGGGLICPTKNMQNLNHFNAFIFTKNNLGGSVSYSIGISKSIFWLNNDSTEIVNGLSGVQSQQQQTNTIISDSNTSSSQSSANTGLNNMNSQITQQVDSLASINTYNSIINNFFTQINNSTCSPISLPMPFVQDKNIVLPCIGTEINNSAPTLWTFWRFMCAGIIGFALWGNMIAFIKGVVDPYNIGANNLPIGGGK